MEDNNVMFFLYLKKYVSCSLFQIVPRNWKIHCHCFTNSYSNAKLWINEFPNLYIGVTPLVTYRSATPTHDLARKLPLNKLLLETDAPYFVPRSVSICWGLYAVRK